jgi:hypothetical protein
MTMAYVYRVSFGIEPDQMSQLQIGASLERVLGYLRALLPSESGHINSRALRGIDESDSTQVVVESTWDTWEDVDQHRRSSLAENKVLTEFEPHVKVRDLTVHLYQDVD